MINMLCPYCGKEMKRGIMSGDGRQGITWKEGEKPAGFIDKLCGEGIVTVAKWKLTQFTIEADFCPDCKKMIIDTDVLA